MANANEKTLRWWSCAFTIDGIKYKGSIKKLAANSITNSITNDDPTVTRNANNQEYILIELTNKIYYHHYTMHTNIPEIIEKIQELAPSLLTSNTNINDTELIRHLPSLITLIHSQRHHNDQHNGIVLRYRLNEQEQIIENEAEAQWLKKHPFKRRMSLRATTSTTLPSTMETSKSNKRKDINGGEEEQQESFDFHEDLVISNSSSSLKELECIQIKSKDNGNWTINALTKQPKGKNSIIGMLYHNRIVFEDAVKTLTFMSNGTAQVTVHFHYLAPLLWCKKCTRSVGATRLRTRTIGSNGFGAESVSTHLVYTWYRTPH